MCGSGSDVTPFLEVRLSLLSHQGNERACHPERSAQNARVAKDLLCFWHRKQILRACGAQDDMLRLASLKRDTK